MKLLREVSKYIERKEPGLFSDVQITAPLSTGGGWEVRRADVAAADWNLH